MQPIILPKNMRPPTLKERTIFYTRIFSESESKGFTEIYQRPAYAIDVGNESLIYKPSLKKYIDKLVYISNPPQLTEKLIKYAPEDVYYSRNITKDGTICRSCRKRSISCPGCKNFQGQELAFDIDPENIECKKCTQKKEQSIYSFCIHQMEESKLWTIRLYEHLKNFHENIRVVYSGRGYHIHVLDRDAYKIKLKDRQRLIKALQKNGYPIDPWVTSGSIDLIRLPGSLHGLVNRIVKEIPIKEIEKFDPLNSKKVIPDYRRSSIH